MKTTNLFKNSFQAAAAFLFATVMLGFSACSEMDNPAGPSALVKDNVVGAWYAEYAQSGTIYLGETEEELTEVKFEKVVQYCVLEDDNSGAWAKFLLDGDGNCVMQYGSMIGVEPDGELTYTFHPDGKISISLLRDDSMDESPQSWTVTYANGHITGKDGKESYTMTLATEEQTAIVAAWDAQNHGGGDMGTDYNINSDSEVMKGKPFTKANWRDHTSIYCWTRENIREADIQDANGGRGYYEVMLPWALQSGSTGTLPVNFCKDMLQDKDWNLVMNYCGRRYPSDANYMAFYHAYTGKLRIFYYIPEHAESGASDHFFQVLMPNAVAEHSPFGYGVPINSTLKNPKLIDASVNTANYLTQYITPYSAANSQMGNIKPTAGWYAFDIDLSLYRNNTFGPNSNPLQFKSRCLNKSLADFYGTQMGSLDGSINLESCSVNSTGGIFGPLEDVLGQVNGIKDFISGAAKVYSDVMSGDILGAIEGGISVAKQGCDLVGIDYGNQTEGFNGYKGDVNLKLSTKIDLKGQITQETVMKGLTDLQAPMTYFDFDQTHLGEGVWNIESAPIVYYTNAQIAWRNEYCYDDPTLFWEKSHLYDVLWLDGKSPFNAQKKAEHKGSMQSTATGIPSKDPWCGYVTYFDPTNIKVKLNDKLFTPEEIATAKVYATCGVRKATSAFGSLDNYRAAFGLNGSKFSINMKNGGDYYNRPFDEAPFDALSSSEDKHDMKTGVTFPATKYDGYNCGMFGRGDENFILEPQSLSGSDHALTTYMPSYEVTVTVIVNHNGKPIVYSRSYLPEYVKMDVANMRYPSERMINENRPANYVPAIYAQQMKHIGDIYNWTRRTFQGMDGLYIYNYTSGEYSEFSEGWPALIDGTTSTKWCSTKEMRDMRNSGQTPREDKDRQSSWWCIFRTNYPVNPTGYTFVNGNDTQRYTERRPRVWYIWGKFEKDDPWQLVAYEHTSNPNGTPKPNAMPTGNFEEKSYKFNGTYRASMQYFMIEILSNWSDDDESCMQLSEFRFTYDN